LIGRKCYEAYYGRNTPCEQCPVAATIETQKPASSILKIAKENTTLQIFSYPIPDEKGDLVSIIEYVRDITEEQQLQEQLIQSEKLAGIGTLASGVAHEINNPLTVIIGMTEVALEEEDPSEIKDYLKDVFRSSQRIKEIVRGLSSYSRIARQDEQGLVSINEVLEESLKMVGLAMKAHEVEVLKKFRSADKIEANIGEIQQVFTNLISNAYQAMDGKGGKLILATRSLKDSIEVKVSDTGTGIPQKSLNKIFDPFFTTKELGKGTGLGLNIVHRIVQKHEGMVDVKSKEGKGTTFTITFPMKRDE
jgi:signal transduction histidine kinase